MSSFEYVTTGVAHAATGALMGSAVDAVFPRLESAFLNNNLASPQTKSALQLSAEVLLQFSLGYLSFCETMHFLMPAGAYQSPIGDGTGTYFYFATQYEFWRKVKHLRNMVRSELDTAEMRNAGAAAAKQAIAADRANNA